jgi:tRNA nucleotidyltransferase/poly(A) polymerase
MTNLPKLPKLPKQVISTMKKNGYECFAVGGAIRDMLANGKKPLNWDFATNAKPEEILKVFPDGFYDNVFGTVGIQVEHLAKKFNIKIDKDFAKEVIEITTYRTESAYRDRRRPEKVEWGNSLKEDLKRRDFTINAIATDGEKIIDPFGGQKDLKNKLIRAVGNPDKRFKEDALRLARAVRIATELEFLIEEKTRKAIENNAQLLGEIAKERIRDELLKILSCRYAADGVLLLYYSGLLNIILPELEKSFKIPQKSPERHHIYDVGTHSIESLRYCPNSDPIVRFATLIHDLGKLKTFRQEPDGLITFYNHEIVGAGIARNIIKRLRFSKKQSIKIIKLVRWHQFSMDEKQTDKALRRFIRRIGKENISDMLDLRIGDRLGGGARETSWRFELFKKRLEEVQVIPFTVHDLKIDGNDVMKILKIKPSRKVGEVLDKIFEMVEDKKIENKRETLLKEIKNVVM